MSKYVINRADILRYRQYQSRAGIRIFAKSESFGRARTYPKPSLSQISPLTDSQIGQACKELRRLNNLRPDNLSRFYPVIDESRLPPMKPRETISQIDKGTSPYRRKILHLLRKAKVL